MDLAQTRKDLAQALIGEGLKVFPYVPEKITPPVILMRSGDPYVEPTETSNELEFTVNVELVLVAASGTNAKAADDLDAVIEKVIVHTGGWVVQYVSAPFIATVGDYEYLTATVSLGTQFEAEN